MSCDAFTIHNISDHWMWRSKENETKTKSPRNRQIERMKKRREKTKSVWVRKADNQKKKQDNVMTMKITHHYSTKEPPKELMREQT